MFKSRYQPTADLLEHFRNRLEEIRELLRTEIETEVESMPDPLSVVFVTVKMVGVLLALVATGYLIFNISSFRGWVKHKLQNRLQLRI